MTQSAISNPPRQFSRIKVQEHLARRADALQECWGFNPDNGWAQVSNSDTERTVAYGQWDALHRLRELEDGTL